MASMFYGPALEILKSAKGGCMTSNQVRNAILERYPDLKWGGTQGPIRAMLLSAAKQGTAIRQVPDKLPPMFYYDETSLTTEIPPNPSPEEVIVQAVSEINEALKQALLEKVREMDDAVFEELVNSLIERLGFGNHYTTPKSHDKGIDGMLFGDSLGLNVVCVQAKHYIGHNVERKEIDAFIGALEGRNGVFVTTSSFSKGAQEKARHTGCASHIALIDGEKLVELMLAHNMGVEETEKRFVIKRIDNDFFSELEG